MISLLVILLLLLLLIVVVVAAAAVGIKDQDSSCKDEWAPTSNPMRQNKTIITLVLLCATGALFTLCSHTKWKVIFLFYRSIETHRTSYFNGIFYLARVVW